MKTLPFQWMFTIVLLLFPLGAWADITIDFENNPPLPPQPNNFAAAGPMQTYTQAGVYTVSGGVVLGNPTFLAAFAAHGSAPNLYGTADFADATLLDQISFVFPQAQNFTSLTGVLFNGQPVFETYTVTAHTTGGDETTTYNSVEPDSSTLDFRNFTFNSSFPIIGLDITTPNAGTNGWDFFVDTVHATSSPAPIPEPSSMALLGTVAGSILLIRRRRHS